MSAREVAAAVAFVIGLGVVGVLFDLIFVGLLFTFVGGGW